MPIQIRSTVDRVVENRKDGVILWERGDTAVIDSVTHFWQGMIDLGAVEVVTAPATPSVPKTPAKTGKSKSHAKAVGK